MRCNAEFYCVGKIPPIGIGLQRRVVLKWFYSPRAVGTTLSEVHALYRVPSSWCRPIRFYGRFRWCGTLPPVSVLWHDLVICTFAHSKYFMLVSILRKMASWCVELWHVIKTTCRPIILISLLCWELLKTRHWKMHDRYLVVLRSVFMVTCRPNVLRELQIQLGNSIVSIFLRVCHGRQSELKVN